MTTRMPTLEELGLDLLETTLWQRWQPMFVPFVFMAGAIAAAHLGHPVLFFACVGMVFSACSTSTHDVVHGALGLNRRATEWLLLILGAPIFESGHAYRATHLKHHASFPEHDDLEGEAAHMAFWQALVSGPSFLPRLWLWAWRYRPGERAWLVVEGSFLPLALGFAISIRPITPGPLAYVVTVWIASWFYPIFAVYLPHRGFTEERVHQAWTLRGRLVPRLFLPLAYHLEHHLYPKTPSHNLPKLAARLERFFDENGVKPIHVP